MTRARYFAINYLPIYRDSPKQASPREPGAASLLIVYLRPPIVLSRAHRLSHPPPLSRYLSLSFSLPRLRVNHWVYTKLAHIAVEQAAAYINH